MRSRGAGQSTGWRRVPAVMEDEDEDEDGDESAGTMRKIQPGRDGAEPQSGLEASRSRLRPV